VITRTWHQNTGYATVFILTFPFILFCFIAKEHQNLFFCLSATLM